MLVTLLRRILAVVIVIAYVGATMLQVVPATAANATMSQTTMGGMDHGQDNPGDKMPCKGMLPGCITDLGCIFLVSLPPPDLALVTLTAWFSVSYDNRSQGLDGRTIKPALGPPISLA
jgi:hypothetical protein